MAVRLHRPDDDALTRLLAGCRDQRLTYSPTGGSLRDVVPVGMSRHRWTVTLPSGTFDAAVEAIRSWSVHRRAGLSVATDGPFASGTNIALSAPLPAGFVDATCRIVTVIDEPDRFGFAYGTLPVHPECGEEAFLVVAESSAVRFDVQAVSKPRHPLARLVPPIATRLQDAAVRRYLAAMAALVDA